MLKKDNSLRIDTLLKLLLLLNVIDGMATYYGLSEGFYVELNQVLNDLYTMNSLYYLGVKVVLPTMVLMLLLWYITRDVNMYKIGEGVRRLVVFALIIYILLLFYHIVLYSLNFLIL